MCCKVHQESCAVAAASHVTSGAGGAVNNAGCVLCASEGGNVVLMTSVSRTLGLLKL